MTKSEAMRAVKAAAHQVIDRANREVEAMGQESLAEVAEKSLLGRYILVKDAPLDFGSRVAAKFDEIVSTLPDVMAAALPDALDDADIESVRDEVRGIGRRLANESVAMLRRRSSNGTDVN